MQQPVAECPIKRAQWDAPALLALGTQECRDLNEKMNHLVNRHVLRGCNPDWERDLLPVAEPRRVNPGCSGVDYCADDTCTYTFTHLTHVRNPMSAYWTTIDTHSGKPFRYNSFEEYDGWTVPARESSQESTPLHPHRVTRRLLQRLNPRRDVPLPWPPRDLAEAV